MNNITKSITMEIFRDGRILAASEVATKIGISVQGAHSRLNDLVDAGVLHKACAYGPTGARVNTYATDIKLVSQTAYDKNISYISNSILGLLKRKINQKLSRHEIAQEIALCEESIFETALMGLVKDHKIEMLRAAENKQRPTYRYIQKTSIGQLFARGLPVQA